MRTSETGTWFQSPEAYDFFASLPELMEPFVYGIESEELRAKSQELRAVCVGYVTKERNPIQQFFTRRAIIVGGPAIDKNYAKEDVEILLNYIRKDLEPKSIYVETRNFNDFSPWKEAFEAAGFAYKPHLNFHIDCSSQEQIDAQMSNVRKRQVRKAIRSGAVIEESSLSDGTTEPGYHTNRVLPAQY